MKLAITIVLFIFSNSPAWGQYEYNIPNSAYEAQDLELEIETYNPGVDVEIIYVDPRPPTAAPEIDYGEPTIFIDTLIME